MDEKRTIVARRLTREAFAPFGDVIALRDAPDAIINAGLCARHHDLAGLDFAGAGAGTSSGAGRAGISLFDAEPRRLPYRLDLMERHPLGSQAFLPMHAAPFLVVVAPDAGGRPGVPVAFVTDGREGVNYARGTWHGVLAPLGEGRLFAVVDRIGEGDNLEEWAFETPWTVEIDTDRVF